MEITWKIHGIWGHDGSRNPYYNGPFNNLWSTDLIEQERSSYKKEDYGDLFCEKSKIDIMS